MTNYEKILAELVSDAKDAKKTAAREKDAARQRKWRAEHKEEKAESSRKYNKKNRVAITARRKILRIERKEKIV